MAIVSPPQKARRCPLPAITIGFGASLLSSAALASECGIYTPPNQAITCNSATFIPPGPISYDGVEGLTLTIDDPAINISASGRAAVSVVANPLSTNDISIIASEFGDIETNGSNAYALIARHEGIAGNASVTLSSGTIVTNSFQGHAAYAWIADPNSIGETFVTMNGGDFLATGDRGRGLYSRNQGTGNATAVMNNGTIRTSLSQGHGILSNTDNFTSTATSRAIMNGGTVLVEFDNVTSGSETANGLYAFSRGLGNTVAIMNGGRLDITPENSYGIHSLLANSAAEGDTMLQMNGGSVLTRGDFGYGIWSQNNGSGSAFLEMNGGTIETFGDFAAGAIATGAITQVTMSDGDIRAAGSGIWSIASSGISTITVENGVIRSGLRTNNSFPTAAIWSNSPTLNIVNISENAVVDGSGSGLAIREGDLGLDGIDEDASTVIVTTLGDVTGDAVLGLGNDVFNLVGGTFNGDIYGDDALAVNLNFADFVFLYDGVFSEEQLRGVDPVNGVGQDDTFNWSGGVFGSSFFGGNGSDAANVTASTYDGTYHVLDGGDDYAAADGWVDVLTLSGDASGDIDGANVLNWERVVFDGVAVSLVDGGLQVGADPGNGLFLLNGTVLDQSGADLVLTGNMTNAASLRLQDSAVGDMVTIDGDYAGALGVLLLDVDTSTDTADTLTVTGASSGLTAISVNNLSPSTATGNDILLVSVTGASAEGDFALNGGPLVAGAFQYGLEYQTGDFVLASALSSTGAVYEAAPHVLLDSITRMPTLEQRVGQRRWNSAAGTLEPSSGGWLRVFADRSEAALNTGTSYNSDSWGLQAGFDLPVEPGENGQWVLGLTAQTGRVSGGIATATGGGTLEAESLGFGLTGTWYGYDGTYVDLQGQVNWGSVDYSSSLQGSLAESEVARMAAASIELGRRYALDENRGLIPQAQLVWAHLDGGSFSDSAGNVIDLGTSQRVTGRLGLAYDYEWRDEARGSMQNVYGIVNIVHDFSGDASVRVGGARLESDREATQGEIGLGGSLTWDRDTTLYGELSYRRTLGGGADARALAATAGLRIQW